MKGPEVYLQTIGVHPSCAIRADRPAVLDESHRAFVNHEIYFFSSRSLKKRFLSDPLRWCGVVTDPVSGLRFQPSKDSPRTDHGGRPYFFISDETRGRFEEDPPLYAEARRAMPAPATQATPP